MGRFFTIDDLIKSETAIVEGIDNNPKELAIITNLNNLIDNCLDVIRLKWGKPIRVNCGYRCEILNKAVGGVSNSEHLYGMAADITTGSKVLNKQLFELIKEMGVKGEVKWRQLKNIKSFSGIHISYNPKDNKCQIL